MAALAPHRLSASAQRTCAPSRPQLLMALPRASRPTLVGRCASAASATAETEVVTSSALAPGAVHSVSASQIPAVLEAAGPTPVLVDVYTQWCGPCKMIAPELEKMASEDFKDNVIFTKIDCTSINENKKWAMAQNVKALPTFILYKNGQRVADMTGAKVAALRKLIETHL